MRLRCDESGQTLVLTALSMAVLLGFMALAIDVGLLFRAKREAQTAADAAAVAAALDYEYNTSATSARNAGYAAAKANGFDNTKSGITVTVNVPPGSGPKATITGYAEAIVGRSNPTFFMSMFSFKSLTASARAVAGNGGAGPACIYTLGGSGIVGSGTGAISAPSCPIDDNGNIVLSGSETVTASQINLFGSVTDSGGSSVSPTPVKSRTVANPLASLTPPTVSSPCTATLSTITTNSQGCYSAVVTSGSATINLNPGTYVINGGITASGNLNIVGTGVTLYIVGNITGSGNVGLNITAPTSGPYNGIALWIAGSGGLTLSGSSTTSLQGIVYLPNSSLTFSGTTGMTLTTDLIVQNITFSGSTTINNYAAVNTGTALGNGAVGNGTFTMVE